MKHLHFFLVGVTLFCSIFFFVSCSSKRPQADTAESVIPTDSIIVMPVDILTPEHSFDYTGRRQLERGAETLTAILEDLLSQNKNVQFISASQKESLLGDFNGNPAAVARHVARQTEADAVLLISLNRFIEREGSEHSINQPASVSFQYRLIHVENGSNLCFGKFDETQEALFSNLFSFSKAYNRGFKWITAKKLAREGLVEKFSQCPHLLSH